MWFRTATLTLALILSPFGLASAENKTSGESIAFACMGCHGTVGMSATAIPPIIKGLPADYFANALRDFQSGKRSSTIMGRIVKGFNDDEIIAVAEYFSSLK